jgi:anti-sigma-K factor RskA
MTAPSNTHHNHDHADDLLDGYLLGTLSTEDAAWIESHVHECPRCREEIAPLMAAVQALPFSAPAPDVPMSADLWDRIERSVSSPTAPKREHTAFIPLSSHEIPRERTASSPRRWGTREWLAIAAVALISLLGGTALGQALPQFLGDEEPEQQVIALQFTDPDVTASGELRYLPDEQVFVLEIAGLPELPEGQVYQAWLIDGSAPVPVGVVDAATGEMASSGDRNAYQTFAITVEQGPLGNPAPTSDPIIVASLQETGSS